MTEEWRDIPGFPYQASNQGRVRRTSTGFVLKPKITKRGYSKVCLWNAGKDHHCQVSRLVLMAFVGPPNGYQEAAHGDGVPSNNHLSNLRWASAAENAADRYRHGTVPFGTKVHTCKLSENDVRTIRQRLAAGQQARVICRDYDVHEATIGFIKNGRYWSWLV